MSTTRKVHFRIPEQVAQRFYGPRFSESGSVALWPGMKSRCGNKQAKYFDVSANDDVATCKRCIALKASQAIKGSQPGAPTPCHTKR